jgi:hypothetical protein
MLLAFNRLIPTYKPIIRLLSVPTTTTNIAFIERWAKDVAIQAAAEAYVSDPQTIPLRRRLLIRYL